ncbi:helix-turn-helix transcriptional regulator [Sphingobium sp. AR-3-1]|uniref:Helix-turn-helix transcriptional regulator n=1 Tax=Sphingobium psychrophilum TaxID=2728834 RepID=A0A7X9WUB3_9SPHN|nr:helix-turn-helix transcriptional regulator [Sphingobium psychrophilum]NML10071.1 helix-turn-helix transcriptional regulator [Sphingobium psychrophilum]
MTVQIVEIAGQKIAMLPIEDYQRLVDIAEDRADGMAAVDAEHRRVEGEEYVPVEVIDKIMAGDSPLRAWRKYRNLTLQQLGLKAGITSAYLSDLERGNNQGSIGTWIRLAESLTLSLSDIAPES